MKTKLEVPITKSFISQYDVPIFVVKEWLTDLIPDLYWRRQAGEGVWLNVLFLWLKGKLTDYHVACGKGKKINACGHSSIPVLILTQELTGNSSIVKQLTDNRCVIMLIKMNHDTLSLRRVTTGTVNSKFIKLKWMTSQWCPEKHLYGTEVYTGCTETLLRYD